jgi:hypothetical protein
MFGSGTVKFVEINDEDLEKLVGIETGTIAI